MQRVHAVAWPWTLGALALSQAERDSLSGRLNETNSAAASSASAATKLQEELVSLRKQLAELQVRAHA